MFSVEIIESIKDPRIVEARSLISASGRQQKQKCLLEGSACIQFALREKIAIEHIFCSQPLQTDHFLHSIAEKNVPCFAVSEGILKKISHTNYLIPYIGVMSVPPPFDLEKIRGEPIMVLGQIEDHEALGAIIQAAYFAGIRNIGSTASNFDLFFRRIVAASHCTVFGVRQQYFSSQEEAFHRLQMMQYEVIHCSFDSDFSLPLLLKRQSVALFIEK
jgi:TrmH family RNA methyltransferase